MIVRGKVFENAPDPIEMFNLMAVENDSELRSKLADLKNLLAPIINSYSDCEIEQVKEILAKLSTSKVRLLLT